MREQSTEEVKKSSVVWENLEGWVRNQIQGYLQHLLEEEVRVFLGREKSERRAGVDSPVGYRNGYGKPRRLALSCGTVELERPRVRGVEERFESRLLPLFVRRTGRWRSCFRAYICMGYRRGILSWRCAGCWAMEPRSLRVRLRGSKRSGRKNVRFGAFLVLLFLLTNLLYTVVPSHP
jgi:Transposase, Mutator family